jgi:hypothetical protein
MAKTKMQLGARPEIWGSLSLAENRCTRLPQSWTAVRWELTRTPCHAVTATGHYSFTHSSFFSHPASNSQAPTPKPNSYRFGTLTTSFPPASFVREERPNCNPTRFTHSRQPPPNFQLSSRTLSISSRGHCFLLL